MKPLVRNLSVLTFLFASGHGSADVIYSGLLDTPIPTTFDGVTVVVAGGSINPFMGGKYLANDAAFQPARLDIDSNPLTIDGLDTVQNFSAGQTIGGSLNYASGSGGSMDHLGYPFADGTQGYLGFKLNATNYGWMRVVLTNDTNAPVSPVIKDWAYDTSGGAIVVGRVEESILDASTRLFTLSPATTGESFTLGSQITLNPGKTTNVLKTGLGTTTLTGSNSYTGTTIVSNGTLLVNGSISGHGAVIVDVGATLGGTGSIAGPINVSGVLSPGASVGSFASGALTMTTGSTFTFEATDHSASGADLMVVNGSLALTGVTLDLSAANLGLSTWDVGDKLTLISYTGAITSGFTGYADDTIYTGGVFGTNQWMFNYNDTLRGNNHAMDAPAPGEGVSFVTFTVVPEPGVALLGSLGLLALLRRRR